MNKFPKIRLLLLALASIAVGIAWWHTRPAPPGALVQPIPSQSANASLVDESTYATALRLAQLASDSQEQAFAASALRIADHELALAFTAALRDAEAHPPVLSPEAQKIQDRLRKSRLLLDTDQQRVTQLTTALAAATASQQDVLQDELDLAQSQLDLDKDEVEEAEQDLVAAGGNPQQRIEIMVQEHDAQVKARAAAAPASGPTGAAAAAAAVAAAEMGVPQGSWYRVREWSRLKRKARELEAAQRASLDKAQRLYAQRTALADKLEDTKGNRRALPAHEKRQGCGQSDRCSGESRGTRAAFAR